MVINFYLISITTPATSFNIILMGKSSELQLYYKLTSVMLYISALYTVC